MWNQFADKLGLFKPTNSINLGLFRLGFGIIMALQFNSFYQYVPRFTKELPFLFTYDFFHWVKPVPNHWWDPLFVVFVVSSLLFAAGILYRVAAVVQFLGVFYIFHLDKTLYNNHYYLFVLICLLMIFVDAHKRFSVRAFVSGEVKELPYWQLFILKAQLFIVYFYGGVAKINTEWLIYAQPIQLWLPDMIGRANYADLSAQWRLYFSYFIAYSGLLIDLSAGFLLWSKRTRKYIIPILITFHVSNYFMFNIGYFPPFAILATVLFIDPDWLSGMIERIQLLSSTKREKASQTTGWKKRVIVSSIAVYIAAQCLIPLRHWVIPGYYFWNERGFYFSWFMKLRTKRPVISVKVNIGNDPQDYYLALEQHLTKKQTKILGYKPTDMVRFAHYLEEFLKEEMNTEEDMRIYAEVYTSLHAHPHQLLLNPYIDLTSIDVKNDYGIERHDWVVPWGKDTFQLERPIFLEQ